MLPKLLKRHQSVDCEVRREERLHSLNSRLYKDDEFEDLEKKALNLTHSEQRINHENDMKMAHNYKQALIYGIIYFY
jgi:hypothetical protein